MMWADFSCSIGARTNLMRPSPRIERVKSATFRDPADSSRKKLINSLNLMDWRSLCDLFSKTRRVHMESGMNDLHSVRTGFHVDSASFREEITKRSPVHQVERVDKLFSR